MVAVTAVSGFRPPYFRAPRRGDDRGRILLGLSREISTQLVVQTMLGTAKQLRRPCACAPVELREMVTSPGGTTIAAIRELEQVGVRAAFVNTIQGGHGSLARARSWIRTRRRRPVVDEPTRLADGWLARFATDGAHIRRSRAARPWAEPYTAAWPSPQRRGQAATSGTATSVPSRPTTSARNHRLVRETLLDRLARAARGHRVEGSSAPPRRPERYDSKLEGVTIDLALNGIGADGHTASLFPRLRALGERERCARRRRGRARALSSG